MSVRFRQIAVILLLAAGVRLGILFFGAQRFLLPPILFCIAAALAAGIRPIRRAVALILQRADERKKTCAWSIAAAVAIYFAAELANWHAQIFLKLHDEHVYMIQARMLLHGRLWMSGYPADVRPFFDSIYLINDRVYAGMYFPGTALALAPVIAAGLPYWVMTAATTVLATIFFFLISADIFGDGKAIVAVLLLLSVSGMYTAAVTLISIAPFLAALFAMIWGWLKFRKNGGLGWALGMGVTAGFAAIVRPLDALCFAAPVGVAMVSQTWKDKKKFAGTAAAVLTGAILFLALQVIQNVGVTGACWRTAEGHYIATNYPAPVLGFYHVDEAAFLSGQPSWKRSFLDWILFYYRQHHFSTIDQWGPVRIQQMLLMSLPLQLVGILIPAGLMTWAEPRRGVIVAGLGLFIIAYMLNVFNLNHYMIPATGPLIWLVMMGWEAVETAWPRWRAGIATFITVVLLGSAGLGIISANQPRAMDFSSFNQERVIDQQLATLPDERALVLFRDAVDQWPHGNPVYNDGAAWPDDLKVVRAWDLDGHDEPLFRYFAATQPDRVVYLYDQTKESAGGVSLMRLGRVAKLAR